MTTFAIQVLEEVAELMDLLEEDETIDESWNYTLPEEYLG